MDELVLFASKVVEVEGSWEEADETAFNGETGALMELIGIVLEYGEEGVLCTVVVGAPMDVKVFFLVLFSEGGENVRHWLVIRLCV